MSGSRDFFLRCTGDYVGGLMVGLGSGLWLSNLLLMGFLALTGDYETPQPPLTWSAITWVIWMVLLFAGAYVARRAQRRRPC